MAQLSVSTPPWIVLVGRATANGESAPTYDKFTRDNRLRFENAQVASSNVGQSYAVLSLASGKPFNPQIDVEYADEVASIGDRVMIGLDSEGGPEWKFAGYLVTGSMLIDRQETFTYRVAGPEWIWGGGDGAYWQIIGQFRRNGDSDDHWANTPTHVSQYSEWDYYPNERAIFNPDGRANMTSEDVVLTPEGQQFILGRIWETPDRRVAGTPRAELWNIRQAVKMLVTQYNPYPFSGIQPPFDWNDDTQIPFTEDEILPETDVTGLGLWEALRRVLGPKYYFSVDPAPNAGPKWGGFKLRFHTRLTGPDADLQLNAQGTPISRAVPSVTRLESAYDISQTVNRVVIYGRDACHVRLVYWGGAHPKIDTKKKKTALQQAWQDADGLLSDYSTNQIINKATIDESGLRQEWLDRYVSNGKLHLQYANVFRTFAWNEDGALPTTWVSTYGFLQQSPVYQPNLSEIADSPERPFLYSRRRRPALDSLFLRNPNSSSFDRVRPTLYMAIAPSATDTNFVGWTWRKVPESAYEIDPSRCTFRFTADDLSEWKPFDKQDIPTAETSGATVPRDARSFATLMVSGVLRLCFECSVETDAEFAGWAGRRDASGSPLLRERVFYLPDSFVNAHLYDDGLISPSGLVPAVIDMADAIQAQAEMLRDAGEDAQLHANIMTAADWPVQPIGSMIFEIGGGRKINMHVSQDRGAQIVAYTIDPRSFKIQYLTESVALELRARDRRILGSTRVFNGSRAKANRNQQ